MQYPNNQQPQQDSGGDRTGIFSNQGGYYPGGSSSFNESGYGNSGPMMPSFSGNWSPNTGITGGGSPANSAPSGISNGTALGQIGNGTFQGIQDPHRYDEWMRTHSGQNPFGQVPNQEQQNQDWQNRKNWTQQDIQNYGASRGIQNFDPGGYWMSKWNEWGQKDPNYFNMRLGLADEFTPPGQRYMAGQENQMPQTMAMMQGQAAQPYVRPQGNFLMNNRLGMFGGRG